MANNTGSKGLLFLFNPFISAIDSIINIRDKQSQKLLYLWFLIFGAAFCAVNEAADSSHWVMEFDVQSKFTFNQLLEYLAEYFSGDSYIKDIYSVLVNFIVGRFTSNYHWTYLIYAAIFGYFYIKSISYLVRYDKGYGLSFFCLLLMFCIENPIFNINGMRFWTAAWISVYVICKVWIDDKKSFILLLLLTPLIHNAFYIMIAMVIIAIITRKLEGLWAILFYISCFVSAISFLDIVSSYSQQLSPFFQSQIENYVESEYATQRMAGTYGGADPLYAKILKAIPNYYRIILTTILVINRKKLVEDSSNVKLFSLFIIVETIANFISPITALVRFKSITLSIMVLVWIQNYEKLSKYNYLLLAAPAVYAYTGLYLIRNVISVTEWWLYVCPAPITLIKYLLFS